MMRAAQAGFFALIAASAACGAEGSPLDGAPVDQGTDTGTLPSAPGATPGDTPTDTDAGVAEPPPPPCDDAQTEAIKKSFEDATTIPADVGAVALIKDRSCGYRYFTRGASKDVPEKAIHLIGSATKTYVASTILLLAEEGKLALADSVTKWIPDVPGGDAVKVEHVLNHTSGIFNYTSDTGYMLAMGIGLHTKYTPRQLLNIAFKNAPGFAPGEAGKWAYSNTNYVILGMIIEAVTGKELGAALREKILTPIGAKSTFFYGTEKVVGDFAFGKTFLGSSGATFMDPSAFWACGNYAGTMADLVDWEEKRGNGTFHSASAQAIMLNGAATGADYTYGAGLVIVGKTDKVLNGNGPAIGHGGDITGFHNSTWYFPEKKATISVMVHSDKGPSSSFPFGATYLEPMLMTVVNPYFGTTPKTP